ncbi:MAG: LodA/GoxA family CTQ-dependent oxidase [Ardenticatenaceae bacterium]
MSDQVSGQFSVDSSEDNGTTFTNDQENELSVTFTASGTWNTGSKINYGPKGKVGARNKNAPYPNNTLYALLAVKSNDEVVGEGASISLTLQPNESVSFVVNDTHYPNNSGQLTVDWQAKPGVPQPAGNLVYKIHPAIGIARVGNSEEFYIGPETAGGLPIQPGTEDDDPIAIDDLRDDSGALKRQAARFRIFAHDHSTNPPTVTEVELSASDVNVEWTVHLANKKACWYQFEELRGEDGYDANHPIRNGDYPEERHTLIIDPGSRFIDGKSSEPVHFSTDSMRPDGKAMTFPPTGLQPKEINTLGHIETDDQGRLLVVAGYGNSGSTDNSDPTHYANNDNWFDDISDGPISAKITFNGSEPIDVEGAWVVVAPPAYAPQIVNMVTLYDVIFDVAVRKQGYRPRMHNGTGFNCGENGYKPNYEREIAPIFKRPMAYDWVLAGTRSDGQHDHFPCDEFADSSEKSKATREYFFNKMRPPQDPNSEGYMPKLAGDQVERKPYENFLTVTETQYFLLTQWRDGHFDSGANVEGVENPSEELDRAVLENCLGGALAPGIEAPWICRNADIYTSPFRIQHKNIESQEHLEPLNTDYTSGLEPGDITKYMAIPWQADFNDCAEYKDKDTNKLLGWWWPPQRPIRINTPDGLKDWFSGTNREMVTQWSELDFVLVE